MGTDGFGPQGLSPSIIYRLSAGLLLAESKGALIIWLCKLTMQSPTEIGNKKTRHIPKHGLPCFFTLKFIKIHLS